MKTLIFMLALSLSACASVGVTRLNPAAAKPKSCALDVFTSEAEVKREFTPVCLLDAKTATSVFADKTMAGAIDKTRPYACECGADAVVVVGGRSEGMNFWTNGQGYATVKAIKYKP